MPPSTAYAQPRESDVVQDLYLPGIPSDGIYRGLQPMGRSARRLLRQAFPTSSWQPEPWAQAKGPTTQWIE